MRIDRRSFLAGGIAAASLVRRAAAAVPDALASGEAIGKGKLLILEDGPSGRIAIVDSAVYANDQFRPTDVLLVASYAGAGALAFPLRRGVKAVIADDAGIGKDDAGISGLAAAEAFGVPIAAVATLSAEMSNGRSLALGVISRVNAPAHTLGVREGQRAFEAARYLLAQPTGKPIAVKSSMDEEIHLVDETPAGKIFASSSSFPIKGPLPHDVVCIGANSARVFAESIFDIKPRGAISNDCGIGKNDSGVAGLALLADGGIAAAAVAAMSARIGDGMSTWRDGIISRANKLASARGVRPGMSARDAARQLL
jgi:hypothetical protein